MQNIYHKLSPWTWVMLTTSILCYLIGWPIDASYIYFEEELNWIISVIALEELVKFIPVVIFAALTKKRTDVLIFALVSAGAFAFVEIILQLIYNYIDYSTPITATKFFTKVTKQIPLHILFTMIPSIALFLTYRRVLITKITAVTLALIVAIYLHLMYNLMYTSLLSQLS